MSVETLAELGHIELLPTKSNMTLYRFHFFYNLVIIDSECL